MIANARESLYVPSAITMRDTMITTIKIDTDTVKKLKKAKIYKHESYEEIINRLLEVKARETDTHTT